VTVGIEQDKPIEHMHEEDIGPTQIKVPYAMLRAYLHCCTSTKQIQRCQPFRL
jgi:hypothetical protein